MSLDELRERIDSADREITAASERRMAFPGKSRSTR